MGTNDKDIRRLTFLNRAVERLHGSLNDALHARAAAATWSKELPSVLFGLRAQLREETGLSPAEAVFGAPIVLPKKFLQNEETSVDAVIKIFSKTLHVPAVSLPRHNSSAQLPSELQADLLSAPLVWVHRGGVIPPLQLLYDGPYAVLRCLKACTAVDATPGSPRHSGKPPGSHPGNPAATKQVSFSDQLVSSPSSLAPPQDHPGTVFLPGKEVFAVPSQVPQTRHPSHHWAPTQRPELGGALWTPAYTPGDGQTSRVYSNNPVMHLYISCYVNAYLLLRLLPHACIFSLYMTLEKAQYGPKQYTCMY